MLTLSGTPGAIMKNIKISTELVIWCLISDEFHNISFKRARKELSKLSP